MTLIVTIDKLQYIDGVPLDVKGLGVLNNREATEITEDGERDYARISGKTVVDGLTGLAEFTCTGTPILTGTLPDVLGYDPADQSGSVDPGTGFDTSPATSLGETWEKKQDAGEAPETTVVTPTISTPAPVVTTPTPTTLDLGNNDDPDNQNQS